jgi:ATP-binding cassette subfamily F protein 3
MLCNADTEYEGVIRLGSGVCTGYFAQDTEKTLNPELSVLEEVSSIAATADLPKMRNYLGSFLFSGDDVFKSVSVLSGGERSRLALLKILLHPANLLILDEPTNHLDINAKQMLLEALKQYDGTMIFVSHDAYFIEHIATKILYLTNDNPPEFFDGDYSYFSYKLEQKEAVEAKAKVSSNATEELPAAALSYKETNKKRNRLTSLKRQSEQLLKENEKIQGLIDMLSAQMALVENYSDAKKITALIEKKQTRQEELEESEERWFLLCDEIESLEAELA